MNEELNKKLAEWVGFKRIFPAYIDNTVDPPISYPARWEFKDKEGDLIWLCDFAPDFTKSLDACFEWLVPEIIDKDCGLSLHYDPFNKEWETAINGIKIDSPIDITHRAETPALTLCLAIEKLIDEEGK